MARLKHPRILGTFIVLATALAVALLSTLSRAQQGARQELTVSGTCARCHVSSTLEWGISKHSAVTEGKDGRLPNCVGCHGISRDHVVDEQNTFKPDRMVHGADIAPLCVECHPKGCASSRDLKNCQNCHHIHALVNPKLDATAIQERAKQLDAKVEAAKGLLAEGEKLLQAGQWERARAAFTSVLANNSGSERARAALKIIARRLKPEIPGFKIVGDQFDPQSGLPKEIVMDGTGIGLVLVPGGTFDLGTDLHADTKPVHSITLAPFYMAKYEMTQAQWKALMGSNPSYYQGDKYAQLDNLPVEQVSYDDCRTMLVALNKRVPGGGVRLPTEAEWEYAARAGSTDAFDVSKALALAWLRDNSPAPATAPAPGPTPAPATGAARGPGRGRGAQDVETLKITASDRFAPHPVGTSKPNAWGLYDMLGNVSEWCSSLAQPYPYNETDGRESASAPGARIVRGANFADTAEFADPTARHSDRPTRKLRWNGVRLAFSPAEPVIVIPPAATPATAPAKAPAPAPATRP